MNPRRQAHLGLYLLDLVLDRTEMTGAEGSAPLPDDPLDLLPANIRSARASTNSTLSKTETNRDNNPKIIRRNPSQTGA